MKVLHLEAGTHLYGGALQALLLVEGLQARGVTNLLVLPEGSAVADEARTRGLPVHTLPMAGEADLRLIPRLRRLILDTGPDLVHLHSRRGADTLGSLAASWAGVPVILSRRVDNLEASWAVGPKYRLYDAVITISEAIRDVLVGQGVPPEKVRCVHSAFPVPDRETPCRDEAFRTTFGLPPGTPVLGMAAQFIRRKGHDVLLEALPTILRNHAGARLLLFGRGPLADEMARRVNEADLEAQVRLPGFRDNLPEILPCLDVLVHPARREGLGVVLLQASAAGIPVVASRVGGIPEVIAHGESGLLVPPDDPGALAEAVSALLADPGKARAMGRRGRELIRERFSVDGMVQGNLAVYREVLGRKS